MGECIWCGGKIKDGEKFCPEVVDRDGKTHYDAKGDAIPTCRLDFNVIRRIEKTLTDMTATL